MTLEQQFGSNPLIVDAVIEIPRGSSNKYEYDRDTGDFRLDRVLYSPMHYPTDYGFIPHTLTEDGDELDIMVMLSQATFPGCRMRARVLGALEMTDEKGRDIKILAAAVSDPRMDRYRDISDVGPHTLKEIEYFFTIYKDLEGKKTVVNGWRERSFADSTVQASRQKGSQRPEVGSRNSSPEAGKQNWMPESSGPGRSPDLPH